VTVLAGEPFGEVARREGLGFHPLFSDQQYREGIRNPDVWHPLKGFKAVVEGAMLPAMRATFAFVRDAVEAEGPGRVAVAASTLSVGARVAEERLGVPTATVHLQPVVFRDCRRPPIMGGAPLTHWTPEWWNRLFFWVADRWFLDPVVAPPVNAFRAEVGLTAPAHPPVSRLMAGWLHSPRMVLGLFPDWYAPKMPGWPAHTSLTGFPLYDESGATEVPAEVEEFLAAPGGPPIVFTPGSANVHARPFFEAAVGACARLGRRGMLLTKFGEQVPADLPAGVRRFAFVPLSAVLPRSAALVHHGGIGTASQGLVAGVPQLVMAMSHDQPDNGDRLKRLGVGEWVTPARFTADRVADMLRGLVESKVVANACRALTERLKDRGESAREEAARKLETLLDRPPPGE
jgi:rhamnosyltransferase subunit B